MLSRRLFLHASPMGDGRRTKENGSRSRIRLFFVGALGRIRTLDRELRRLKSGIFTPLHHPSFFHQKILTYGKKPDAYFALRYKIDGEGREEGLGWASQGWTLAKARQTLAEIRAAKKTGSGPVTLQECRKKAEDARQADRLKPTMTLLWETYKAAHGDRPSAKPDAHNVCPILSRFAKRTPEDIRTAHADALRRDLKGEGKAPQTVKHVLGLLGRLIRYGAKRGLCFMPDISRLHFDMPKVDNIKTECLTPEQAKALFDALDEDQNLAAMVRLPLARPAPHLCLVVGFQWQGGPAHPAEASDPRQPADDPKVCAPRG